MNTLQKTLPIIARILIALIFVLSGASKISSFDGTVAYIASKGLPLASVAAIMAIIVELGGGLMLVFAYRARLAAFLLAGFTFVAAFVFHNFWAMPADEMQNQMIHFMKNLALAGGLLMVVVHGASAKELKTKAE